METIAVIPAVTTWLVWTLAVCSTASQPVTATKRPLRDRQTFVLTVG